MSTSEEDLSQEENIGELSSSDEEYTHYNSKKCDKIGGHDLVLKTTTSNESGEA